MPLQQIWFPDEVYDRLRAECRTKNCTISELTSSLISLALELPQKTDKPSGRVLKVKKHA